MNKALVISIVCVAAPAYGMPLVQESFETDGEGIQYTSNTYVGSESGGSASDFFARHQFDGVGGSNPHPQHADMILNVDGDFAWASEDIASNGNPLGSDGPGIVRLADLNTAGFYDLQVIVGLAISRDDQRWETDDFIRIQFALDGDGGGADLATGSYTTIGQFVGDTENTAGDLRQDTDLDGSANGGAPKITTTLTDYTFSIPVTGNNLSVQLRLDQNGGFEEFVFDNIRVTGTPIPEPSTYALLAVAGIAILMCRGRLWRLHGLVSIL